MCDFTLQEKRQNMIDAGCSVGGIINQSCHLRLTVNHIPKVLAANAWVWHYRNLPIQFTKYRHKWRKSYPKTEFQIQGSFWELYLSTSLKFTRLCDKSDAAPRSWCGANTNKSWAFKMCEHDECNWNFITCWGFVIRDHIVRFWFEWMLTWAAQDETRPTGDKFIV